MTMQTEHVAKARRFQAECVAMVQRTRELKACPMCGYLRRPSLTYPKSSPLPHRNGCELGDLLKRLEDEEKSIERSAKAQKAIVEAWVWGDPEC